MQNQYKMLNSICFSYKKVDPANPPKPFNWSEYLEKTGTQAADPSVFQQVECTEHYFHNFCLYPDLVHPNSDCIILNERIYIMYVL